MKVSLSLWTVHLFLTAGMLTAPTLLSAQPRVDFNGNGLGDVWEEKYAVSDLDLTGDADGDGESNADEEAAGTNPYLATSRFNVERLERSGNATILHWASEPGKAYRPLSSLELGPDGWEPLGEFITATGSTMSFTHEAADTEAARFFQIEVTDVDRDEDGVPDWDELQLPAFDPDRAMSAEEGVADLESLEALFGSGESIVTLVVEEAVAIEEDATAARVRIVRSNGLQRLTIPLSRSGDTDPQRGSVTPDDYRLETEAGESVGETVEIPFGEMEVQLLVHAEPDSLLEVPETLTLTLDPGEGYTLGEVVSGAVQITDAANRPENERLFVAYLVPEDGVVSTGSGFATIRVRGDNASGLLGLGFSSLTSPQITPFLDLDNQGGGSHITGLPPGQLADHPWAIEAAVFLNTDQAMLEALQTGQISLVINTEDYPNGELRGHFAPGTGSEQPPPPGEPPPIEELTGQALRRDVARFLTQATFGPTEASIEALATEIETLHGGDRVAGYRAWIAEQFALTPTSLEAYVRAADTEDFALRGTDAYNYTQQTGEPGPTNRIRAWWTISARAYDQLRQRVAFALSQIFVISDQNADVMRAHYGASHYYDQLAAHADGNYRSLLETVSKSPMMGTYLSHLRNQQALYDEETGELLVSPDENYAREIMQLFSIGLVHLHQDGSLKLDATGLPIATYTNDDITELARVFTGWSFSKRHGPKGEGYPIEDNLFFNLSGSPSYFQAPWIYPMKNFEEYHDSEAKAVLGQPISAGLNGEADLDAALDILFAHENVGPFIVYRLIQRLVTSTPSAGYVYRVADVFADDGTGVRGNLGAVVEAILLDPEARNLETSAFDGFGKQKEPLIRYLQIVRAFDAFSLLPVADLGAYGLSAEQLANFDADATRTRLLNTDDFLGQTPLSSPTVFNWFLPGYAPGGAIAEAGLVAPEMQLTNETQVIQAINFQRVLVTNESGQGGVPLFGATDPMAENIRIDPTPWEADFDAAISEGASLEEAVTALVDRLDLLLMAGRLKARYESAPIPNPRHSIIQSAIDPGWSARDRLANLFYLIVNSPEYLHQK